MELYIEQMACSLLDTSSGMMHQGKLKDDFNELNHTGLFSVRKASLGCAPNAFLIRLSAVL